MRDRTVAQIAAYAKGDLEPAAYASLFHLIADGPMRSGALAESLFSDPSTVSRQVAQLVDRKLVERLADPSDGRASVLAITATGREMADHVRNRRNANLGRVIAKWPASDCAELIRLLDRFIGDYEKCRPDMVAAVRHETAARSDKGGVTT
ncbi:winged helix-turn-helix transcriptional regulator [Antrihabitans cavernicola]|uniref:Winged helix-turn-helix transcriptional regulator n=2 Tax=Antrihabitans cavernicola TaxID=2495913 RepID=A0A5A7SGQ6_9NOCA|nr:winged helix-turn-helix transcriptional regulator [Spelaeibacter cavernicola]